MKKPFFHAHGMNQALPVYVTRKTAHGETAEYEMSLWMTMLAGFMVWLNIVVWGVVGLRKAVKAFR